MNPYPEWLHILSWCSLALAALSSGIILIDVIRRPQKMAIMNVVWAITALYWGPLGLWAYLRAAPLSTKERSLHMMRTGGPGQRARLEEKSRSTPPTRTQIAIGDSHCGAGCTLGDIIGEYLVAAAALTFAGGLFPTRLVVDFILAWAFGIAFQYFTIVPMRGLSVREGIVAAIKADTISIIAFQVGMSIWMLLTYYVIFPEPHLQITQAAFWFMMQIAMILGYCTAYPATAWLLRKGLKEKMPQMPGAAESLERA